MLQHLGLLSFLMLVAGLLFTVLRWKGGLHMTFSEHAASTKASQAYYPLFFIAVLPVLFIFVSEWFAPEFQLGSWFVIIAGLSMFAQIVCSFFPEVGGWKTKVHRVITGISGVLLLPLVAMIALSSNVSSVGKAVAACSLVVMIGLLGIAAKNHAGYRYALLLQVGFYLSFFLSVLVATYLGS